MLDLKAIEEKWKAAWEKNRQYEADADPEKPKFFLTFPYPYMNGYLHMGHFYSVMRTEAFARYKRLRGFNVLFPQGWHCTGSPIESVAKRIREGEQKQLDIMKKQGFTEEQVKKFGDPKYWTEYFPKKGEEDYKNLGMSVDFRRSFITTDLNPHYDKFIQWQFRKLKDNGYVVKGNHPVVWDPKENCPVGDHDRVEGEGEIPQEFLLVKHRLEDNTYLATATLRPDTILGITNLYINPKVTYKKIQVANGECWIVSQDSLPELESQDFQPKVLEDVEGTQLIGKKVEVVGNRKVLCLPATFVDPAFGTGLVHSVPSDSADDLIALWDFQKDVSQHKKYGLDTEEVQAIRPIPVLHTPGYGDVPAEKMLKDHKVKNQNDKKKLDTIRQELYKLSFYNATFNHLYKDFFSKDLENTPVQEGKPLVKKELIEKGHAETYYQLTGKVIARSLSECVVKVVRDQWFMNYSDKDWKDLAKDCLKDMTLYPEKSRSQFEYVLDWLQNWACVREVGLGTKLPWDTKWVIEALSDSTIYMAYYTIAHLIQKENPDDIDDKVFDYIFLSKESDPPQELAGSVPSLKTMKQEFEYWYPLDFRNSGKDLIQNHLSFCIFNHVAIFKKAHWPLSFGVNGWVTVDGEKMSKSRGNFIMLKDLVKDSSVDAARITILSGGEGLDDPNWDSEFMRSMPGKLDALYKLCLDNKDKGTDRVTPADKWMEAVLNKTINDATRSMEKTYFRSALQLVFFDLQKAIRRYLRKTADKPNKTILKKAIDAQVVMLAPFAPFLCEELWQELGNSSSVSSASWPAYDGSKIDIKAIYTDDLVENTRKDIQSVLALAKDSRPRNATLFIAEPWKYDFITKLKASLETTRNPGEILKTIMDSDLKQHGKEIQKILPRLLKNPTSIPKEILSPEEEQAALEDAASFFKEEFNLDLKIEKAQESQEQKANQSLPGKPAILLT